VIGIYRFEALYILEIISSDKVPIHVVARLNSSACDTIFAVSTRGP